MINYLRMSSCSQQTAHRALCLQPAAKNSNNKAGCAHTGQAGCVVSNLGCVTAAFVTSQGVLIMKDMS